MTHQTNLLENEHSGGYSPAQVLYFVPKKAREIVMAKRKNRAPNRILYWWNEILFARYFEYETDLTPLELSESLQDLEHPYRGGPFLGLLKQAKIEQYPNQKGLDFDIQSKRKRKWDFIALTTARAQGRAIVNKGTGTTIVRGSVKFGRFFHFFLLFYLFYFFAIIPQLMISGVTEAGSLEVLAGMSFPLLILGTMMAFYWWRIYTDRNDLAHLVQDAIDEQKSKQAAAHLVLEEEDLIVPPYEEEKQDRQQM